MILAAASLFGMCLHRTPFVGDKPSDVAAAQNAGCPPVLVRRFPDPVDVPESIPVYNSLLDAVRDLW